MNKKKNWDFYAVKIIKQIVTEGEPDSSLVDEFYFMDNEEQVFEESIMLVRVQSINHACKIAETKAKEQEEPYENKYGEQVIWRFLRVADCQMIFDELKTGAEVYSCLYHTNTIDKEN